MLVLGRYDDRGRDKVIEEDIRIGKSAKGEREREENEQKERRFRDRERRNGEAVARFDLSRVTGCVDSDQAVTRTNAS